MKEHENLFIKLAEDILKWVGTLLKESNVPETAMRYYVYSIIMLSDP